MPSVLGPDLTISFQNYAFNNKWLGIILKVLSFFENEHAWIPFATLAVAVALALLIWHYLQRSADARQLRKVIRNIASERQSDIVIPDGMDGQIQIQHILLTAHGILVMDLKPLRGAIFAGEKLEEWSAMDGNERFRFANPLAALRARTAAIRSLVRDVPVHGRVVFLRDTEFVSGRPEQAVTLDELESEFADSSAKGAAAISAFHASWEQIQLISQN